MIKKINLVNFKGIDKAEIEFLEDNPIYLFVGDNEKGKSSILQAIFSLITGKVAKDYLKKGKEKGYVDGDFIIDNIGKVNIRITMNKSGSNSLTITYPDNSKSHIKGDLRDLFKDYVEIEPNEWLNAGKTADGKRWQLSIVKKLLPESTLKQIDDIDRNIDKNQEISENIWNDKLVREKMLEEMTVLDEETMQARQINPETDYKKYEKKFDSKQITDELQEKTKKLALINSAKQFIENINLDGMENEVNEIDNEVDEVDIWLEREMKRIKKEAEYKKAVLQEKQKKLKAKIDENKEKYKRAEIYLKNNDKVEVEKKIGLLQGKINDIETYNSNYSEVSKHREKSSEFEDLKLRHKEKREEIHKLVDKREDLIKSAQLPTDKITFSKEELLFITEDGETVPYHIGVSEARNMEIVLKLNAALNPKTPIFRIDKAGNIGKIWHSIEQYAKDFEKKTGKKMHIFAEKVELGQEKIVMEIFENGNFKKSSTQPKIVRETTDNNKSEHKESESNSVRKHKESESKSVGENKESESKELKKFNDIESDDFENKGKEDKGEDKLGEIDFDSFI